jgi:prolipoprotein diacylglyceryltransferase
MALHIPSLPVGGVHIGPLGIHVYGLMYVIGITLAIIITRRRWAAQGGDPDLVADVALWSVPAGIIGGRIYFDITTPKYIPPHWWGRSRCGTAGLASGVGRSCRGGRRVAAAQARADVPVFMDAVAPALLAPRASGVSATTSTRSFSAGRRACRGAWRSHRRTGPPATRGIPRSTRPSSTS